MEKVSRLLCLRFQPLLQVTPCVANFVRMTVYVNNALCELPDGANVTDALNALQLPAGNGTALAVNSDVVPRAEWPLHLLHPNDRIMIIKATQGG